MSELFGQPLSLTTPYDGVILAPFTFEKEVYHLSGGGDE
jgi:hypothetical protein